MQTVALELMHVMLGLFHALTSQNALALLMHLKHVKLRLFPGPPENLLKDMRHIIHEIHRVIPANDQETRLQPRFRFFFNSRNYSRTDFRSGSFDHGTKLEDDLGLVESGIGNLWMRRRLQTRCYRSSD